MTTVSKKMIEKFGTCICIENDTTEVLVSVDYGPRIVSCKLKGKKNVLMEDTERKIFVDDPSIAEYYGKDHSVWYNYGGHRLWINPEKLPQTYHPDSDPVAYTIKDNGCEFVQKEQKENGLQLSFEVKLENEGSKIEVMHRVKNTGKDTKTFAIWCISSVDTDGIEIIPMGELHDDALPNRVISTWPYTDLSDPRLFIGKEYITLKQEKGNNYAPVNLGYNNPLGVAGYLDNGTLFITRFTVDETKTYSDRGAAFETFSNDMWLEVESLSPLTDLAAGDQVEHKEQWELIATDDVFAARDEKEIAEFAHKYL
jgi:hypothetical protein